MSFDSLIRLKQINQSDISGYITQISDSIISTTTGQLIGIFYPISNPSGYITGGITQQNLNDLNLQLITYINSDFYPNTNPSGYVTTANISGNLAFQTNLTSGINSQFISYNEILNNIPQAIICTFENNVDSFYYSYGISSVSSSGFIVSFSDYLNHTGYILNSIINL